MGHAILAHSAPAIDGMIQNVPPYLMGAMQRSTTAMCDSARLLGVASSLHGAYRGQRYHAKLYREALKTALSRSAPL